MIDLNKKIDIKYKTQNISTKRSKTVDKRSKNTKLKEIQKE